MTDEFLQVLQALWSHRDRHVGRWVSFDGVLRYPVPAQRPHPPIVVGGHARAGLDRAARVGDGWFGWELSVDDTREAVQTLHDLRRRHRVDPDRPFEISIVADRPVTPELAKRYAAAGVDRLVLVPPAMTAEATDAVIDRAATELIPISS